MSTKTKNKKLEMNNAYGVAVTQPESTAIVQTDDSGKYEVFGGSAHQTFSSFVPKTFDEQIDFYNMINAPAKKLGDFINMNISIKHVYAEECEYLDKETGELIPGVRIVLIDAQNVSYSTSSKGVFNCLTKIFKIFGHPAVWAAPINVMVKQITPSENRRVLLLEMVK